MRLFDWLFGSNRTETSVLEDLAQDAAANENAPAEIPLPSGRKVWLPGIKLEDRGRLAAIAKQRNLELTAKCGRNPEIWLITDFMTKFDALWQANDYLAMLDLLDEAEEVIEYQMLRDAVIDASKGEA